MTTDLRAQVLEQTIAPDRKVQQSKMSSIEELKKVVEELERERDAIKSAAKDTKVELKVYKSHYEKLLDLFINAGVDGGLEPMGIRQAILAGTTGNQEEGSGFIQESLLRTAEEEGLDKDVVIHFMDLLDAGANWKEKGEYSHHGGHPITHDQYFMDAKAALGVTSAVTNNWFESSVRGSKKMYSAFPKEIAFLREHASGLMTYTPPNVDWLRERRLAARLSMDTS